ncbi:hypothetical protein TNCV_4926211 [Trichonephila clavipes]|nr:hypothetical protein TNCV_4926211 [Trichonephila clavipes]
MTRREGLSFDEIVHLLREISENESDSDEMSSSNLDSDEHLRLSGSDCKEYEERRDIIDNIPVSVGKIDGAGRGGDVITVEEGESEIVEIPVVEDGLLCAMQIHELEHSGWLILQVREPPYWLCSSVCKCLLGFLEKS